MKTWMLGAVLIATAVAVVGAGAAGAVTPINGSEVGGSTLVVRNSAGDQNEPHVSGNLAVYPEKSTSSRRGRSTTSTS